MAQTLPFHMAEDPPRQHVSYGEEKKTAADTFCTLVETSFEVCAEKATCRSEACDRKIKDLIGKQIVVLL